MILEYRLENETTLYHYTHLSDQEIEIRRLCEFWIKDNRVYMVRDYYSEPGLEVIYVAVDNQEQAYADARKPDGIVVELREFKGEEAIFHPVVHQYRFGHMEEALRLVKQDSLFFDKKVYDKSCLEMDEDRGVLVYYGIKK
jgi:hypothetical protein